MIDRRRFVKLASATASAGLIASPAIAQAGWPNRFVRMICPFPAGGAVDVTARLVSGRLSEIWGQQVVVENKPGAGGNIGAEAAAHADPDGYTIFIVSIGHAVNKFLYPSLRRSGRGFRAGLADDDAAQHHGGAEHIACKISEGVHRLHQIEEAELCVVG